MGLLIGAGSTKPVFPYDYYYGIQWDAAIANPACTRIGRPELHVSLPIQSRMRRCLLADNGTVGVYLHPTGSAKTDTGATANLTGASGQVMVEIPAHYRKFEIEGAVFRCYLSEYALPGFHFVPKVYRSAYEAAIDRTTGSAPKLASVVNTAPEFRGGNNNAAYDGQSNSLLGMPGTNTTLTNYRVYARRRATAGLNGAGWNCDVYDIQKTCYWLYAVEYANFNCQAAYNAQPTPEGYKQGGLGEGVTTLAGGAWNTFNAYNPFVPCGYTNSLGNRTGVVDFVMPAGYGTLTVQVPSYRGLENPFGHVWSWTDGCKCKIQSADAGGLSEFFVCPDPSKFQDNNYNDYEKRGELPQYGGYVKEMLIGEFGENMPKLASGASSTTYFSDYFYTGIPAIGEAQRGVLFGCSADVGMRGGFACATSVSEASVSSAYFGSRLCFIPA
ncbi:hypothetical protein EZS27_001747 [termite gut metagenome]|uniref:Uncharacterized protein n=1 Tax=termite gut metagenome TaxID=433724 RepID=A0A5J4T081_9ZZZZ